jgi:hypothetical protein
MAKENPPQSQLQKPQDLFDTFFPLAYAHAGFVMPALRSAAGSHAYHHCWLTPVIVFFYAGFADCPELIYAIPFWCILIIMRRITHNRDEHSRYLGNSWPFSWLVGEQIARWLELPLVLVVGSFLRDFSEPLGNFVASTSISLFFLLWAENAVIQARRRAMRDGEIEALYARRIQGR